MYYDFFLQCLGDTLGPSLFWCIHFIMKCLQLTFNCKSISFIFSEYLNFFPETWVFLTITLFALLCPSHPPGTQDIILKIKFIIIKIFFSFNKSFIWTLFLIRKKRIHLKKLTCVKIKRGRVSVNNLVTEV